MMQYTLLYTFGTSESETEVIHWHSGRACEKEELSV